MKWLQIIILNSYITAHQSIHCSTNHIQHYKSDAVYLSIITHFANMEYKVTKIYREEEHHDHEIPSDIVTTVLTFLPVGNVSDLLNVCFSSKQWNSRCESDEFWTIYFKYKTQSDFNHLLIAIASNTSVRTSAMGTKLFALLWKRLYKGKDGVFIKERHVLVTCLIKAYELANNYLAAVVVDCGDGLDMQWDDVIAYKNEYIVMNYVKAHDVVSAAEYIEENQIPLYAIEGILGAYLNFKEFVKIHELAYATTKEELLENPEEFVLFGALEEGNLKLVKALYKGKIIWEFIAIRAISSKDPTTIEYGLNKLGLTDFTDVTPSLLMKLGTLGVNETTIRYEPLRSIYLKNYPNDAYRVLLGSYIFMPVDEIVNYIKSNGLIKNIGFNMLIEAAEETGHDYLVIKLKELQNRT